MEDGAHTGAGARSWENACTMVVATVDDALAVLPTLDPKQAFVAGYGRMAELARHLPGRGFVAVAVDPIGRIAGSAILGDRERVIVGRHSQCDLRLDYPTISLRHVAVLLRYEPAGPVLHAWDLATGSPFLTEEGVSERALVSTGPLYLAVGRYAIWFVPVGGGPGAWPPSADAAYEALPRRTFVRSEPRPKHPAREAAAPAGYREPARPAKAADDVRSLVTGIDPPHALDAHDPEIPFGIVTIATAAAHERYSVSAERLACGVLLGRYARCDLLALAGDSVSRVHALLVRLGGETWIIDTASTNGTERRKAAITAAVLEDGDHLHLSDALELMWRRVVHPQA